MAHDGTALERAADRMADTAYSRRARYLTPEQAFNLKYPAVPAHCFIEERDRAFDPETATGLIAMDASADMGLDFPATTPLVLARFARIKAGETLRTYTRSTTEIYYVIEGAGSTEHGDDQIDWAAGDIFILPGGLAGVHSSNDADSLLWMATNEPQLAFEHLQPPTGDDVMVQTVHFPAADIERHLAAAHDRADREETLSRAVVFASEGLEDRRNVAPTLTVAMNQLAARGDQAPHVHNSIAVGLPVVADRCYSLLDGKRLDWQPFATMVTPPAAVHSHYNDSDQPARWLIVQDGGVYYHCRTMGFAFADHPAD